MELGKTGVLGQNVRQSVVATRQKRDLGIARNRFTVEPIAKAIQRKRSDVRFLFVQVSWISL
jgi:hypothetical protein